MNAYSRAPNLAAYQSVAAQTSVDTADPHRLVLLLLDGALDRINSARGCLEHKSLVEKTRHLHRAIQIIDELRDSLNLRVGGPIAANLLDLYDYMRRQLMKANLENRIEPMTEVMSLLQTLRGGWSAIAPTVHGEPTGNATRPILDVVR
jgi:flagellar protein FliS